jgi:hypothetical protein
MFWNVGCTNSFRTDKFTVAKVETGNTIKLKNGYTVTLLGIPDSAGITETLNSLKGKKIRLKFDKSMPIPKASSRSPDKHFYAYVNINKKGINGEIIKEIQCVEKHPFLQDSLAVYIAYAGLASRPQACEEEKFSPEPSSAGNEIVIPAYQPDGSPAFDQRLSSDCRANCELFNQVCDITSPITRNFAVQLAKRDQGEYKIEQVCEIFDYLYTQWKYVNDPRDREYLAKASESIAGTNLAGDCDDFAIVMYSVITAIGGKARINLAWNSLSGHAFTEVWLNDFDSKEILSKVKKKYLQYDIRELYYYEDGSGCWLNLDWTAAFPGGKYFDFTTKQTYIYDERSGSFQCF